MELKRTRRFYEAVRDLGRCLSSYTPSSTNYRTIEFIALTKAFEICLEYGWKDIKREIEDRGLEGNSPKDAVREGARIGLIADPALWIDAINARNLSVHDYFSLGEADFVQLVRRFYNSVKDSKSNQS